MLKTFKDTKKFSMENFHIFHKNLCILMNYNKLQDLLNKNKLSIEKATVMIGRTPTWFHYAKKNDTMTIKDLTALLNLCHMSLAEFLPGLIL